MFAERLQDAHDDWCLAVRFSDLMAADRERAFLKLIDHPKVGAVA